MGNDEATPLFSLRAVGKAVFTLLVVSKTHQLFWWYS